MAQRKYEDYEDENSLTDETWNDFEMDDIFWNMNTTKSSMGELSLYQVLRSPLQDVSELEARNQLVNEFQTNETARNHIGFRISMIGKSSIMTIYDYYSKIQQVKMFKRWPLVLGAVFFFFSLYVFGVKSELGALLPLIAIGVNIYLHYHLKRYVESVIPFLVLMMRLLKNMRGFQEEVDSLVFGQAKKTFTEANKIIRKFRITCY